MDREEYEKLEGSIDEYNERLTINNKNNGEYHSRWLKSLYPRLKVARDLLSDDGVIFISIDDNEISNLKRICDEIYGEGNFITNFVWKKRTGSNDSKNGVSVDHEYIIAYFKSSLGNLSGVKKGFENYKNPDNDERGEWMADNLTCNKTASERPNLYYPITDPSTGITYKCNKNRVWAYEKERMNRLIYENKIIFPKKENGTPMYKRHKSEVKSDRKPYSSISDTKINSIATKELREILNNQVFSYPKGTDLLEQLIIQGSDKSDIILDFFSGSATTAHATMQLNAEDNGNRRFIMVQLPELCNEKSEAYKNGYKTICDIGRKRIDLAGEKIKEENKDKEGIESLDIGFKLFRVSDTNIRWISEATNSNDGVEEKDIITQEELRENESYKDRLDFNPWFTDLDVVYEMMLKRQDIELTEKIEKLSYIGDRTYLVGYTILVCLEENITEEMVRKISEIETFLSWIVFRDSAFDDDINLKTNTINLLRTLIKEKNPRNKNQKILWI